MKNHQNRAPRKPAYSAIGLAVITTLLSSGAYAAPEPTGTPYKTVESNNYNGAEINASIQDGNGSITTSGGQSGSTNTLDSNLLRASAIANTSSNSIDLSLTGASQSTDGVASYTQAANVGPVTSAVYENNLSVELNGLANNAVVNTVNTGNAISASSISNNAASSIAGQVPVNYTSSRAGTVQLSNPADSSAPNAATGSIALSTVQQTTGNSGATAEYNYIDTSLYTSGANQVQGAVSVDTNTISTSVKGNSATSTANIRAGGASTFAGSAVIANQQVVSGALDVEGSVGLRANTYDSSIAARIVGDDESSATLKGSLAVKGNSITSSATGNETLGNGTAGNRIVIANEMAFAGSNALVSNSQSVTEGIASANLGASLVIGNNQSNVNTGVSANTGYSFIAGEAEGLAQGTLDVSGNSITSTAKGNAASSAITAGTATTAAAFAGTAALANQQLNENTPVSASTFLSMVGAQAGTYDNAGVDGSAMSATGNRSAATAYGNESAQTLSLNANSLTTGNWPAMLGSSTYGANADVSALGAATVTNLQRNVGTAVTAGNGLSVIGVEADTRGTAGDTLTSSSFTTSGNTQEAVALGNGANNALVLSGNVVGAGAGISSLQTSDSTSSVSAVLVGASAAVNANTHVADSSLAVTGNLQRAIGYGNSVANSVNVKAGSTNFSALDVEGYQPTSMVDSNSSNNGLEFNGGQPTVTAAYGIANNQATQAGVRASAVVGSFMGMGMMAENGLASSSLVVEGNLVRSTANNDANAFIGAAYGNDASNKMGLDLGNVSALNGSVGSVTNVQSLAGQSAVSASATGGTVMSTFVEDSVIDSTVSTSSNVIQALAYGNRATANQLSVKAGNIDGSNYYGSGSGFGLGFDNDTNGVATVGTFAVQNVQTAQGSVSASQIKSAGDDFFFMGNDGAAAEVRVTVGEAQTVGRTISGSSVLADANRSVASATANAASNGLAVEGTNLWSTAALQNVQFNAASVRADIGLEGTAGTPAGEPVPFQVTAMQEVQVSFSGNNSVPVTLLSTIQKADLTADQISYLTANGWTNNANTLTKSTSQGSMNPAQYSTWVAALPETVDVNGSTPGSAAVAAVPNQGGVILAVRGTGMSIADSTLSVSNNVTSGSVTGNSASNSVDVKGVNLSGGYDWAEGGSMGMFGAQVTGANTLGNQQFSSDSTLASNVFGSFGIDASAGTAIDNSTLTVSGNRQASLAVANTAGNSLAVVGTNVEASSGLVSSQYSDSAVSASSKLELFAPVASYSSSISLSDNKNTALAVANDVANTLSVSGSNLGTNDEMGFASVGYGHGYASQLLINTQYAEAATTSTAATTLYNQDQSAVASNGLVSSSVLVSGNSTVAEASANRALNTLELKGSAAMGAAGGISNAQFSDSAVAANATTSTSVSLNTAGAALNQGSVMIEGNSTTALARGNTATNVLNATAGSVYGPAAEGTQTGAGYAQATLAVSNMQSNNGSVSATSNAPSYQVALNSSGLGQLGGVTSGTVSVTGNALTAEALGNSATNRVTVNALSNGTPSAAVSNYQTNYGSINANVTSVNFGIGINAGATNSALRTGGNQVTATAIGNSSVSSIAAAAR